MSYRRTIEPFSMKPRVSYGEVSVRREDGEIVPSINVKPPPLFDRIPKTLRDRAPQRLIDRAYERAAMDFWADARHYVDSFFGRGTRADQVGRSGGHLIVRGLGDPSEWTPKEIKNWLRFEKAVKKLMTEAEKNFHGYIRRGLR